MPLPREFKPMLSSPPRTVHMGGLSKAELLYRLEEANIQLNDAARLLFADACFTTSLVNHILEIVQISVVDLGLENGGTFSEIVERAERFGLSLCPVELGAYFRLQFLDQPEGAIGHPATQHCAPPGSITVASEPLSQDDDFPRGFYLRCIEGQLWLRGYRSWNGHHWQPHDVFAFLVREA